MDIIPDHEVTKRMFESKEAGGEVTGQSTEFPKRRRRSPSTCSSSSKGQESQDTNSSSSATTTIVKRSSRFRGVSRHRWTGRYEAHLWDKASWNPTQKKKGKQVYLGAYDDEDSAARAYDTAALKYWGMAAFTNFPVSEYESELEAMGNVSKEEYLATLRRRSSGFSRGVSKYRGVARHHHNGRWEARIGRVFGNKYLYLGTYGTQEEAARAYDIAAIEYRGINAVTNFELSTYIRWLKPESNINPSQQQESHESKLHLGALPLTLTGGSSSPSIPKLSPCLQTLHNPNENSLQQEIFQSKPSLSSPSSTTSPSALGLLLKSTVFKDLVEKNTMNSRTDSSTTRGKDTEKEIKSFQEVAFLGRTSKQETIDDRGEEEMFREGIAAHHRQAMLPNSDLLSMANPGGQSFWDGSLTLPSFH